MDDFYIKWGRSEYADGGSNGSKGKSDQAHGRSINQEQVPDSRKRLSEPARASKTNNSEEPSRAILAGCCTDLSPEKHARAMSELKGLADACGLAVVSTVIQNAAQITHATYIGSGKVIELKNELDRRTEKEKNKKEKTGV
jgi:hypothetical protein